MGPEQKTHSAPGIAGVLRCQGPSGSAGAVALSACDILQLAPRHAQQVDGRHTCHVLHDRGGAGVQVVEAVGERAWDLQLQRAATAVNGSSTALRDYAPALPASWRGVGCKILQVESARAPRCL